MTFSLLLVLFSCGTPENNAPDVPIVETNLNVICTELAGTQWSVDPSDDTHRFALWGVTPSYFVSLQSFDRGDSWQRIPVPTSFHSFADLGGMGLRLAEPDDGSFPEWVGTFDYWESYDSLSFIITGDSDLPEGTAVAILSNEAQIAVTPMGRVWFQEANANTWQSPPDAFTSDPNLKDRSAYGDNEIITWSNSGYNIAISTDAGHTWQGVQLFDGFLSVIRSVHVTQGGDFIVSYNLDNETQGILISDDIGETWRDVGSIVGGVSMGPDPDELWVGEQQRTNEATPPQFLWHSTDLGLSWERIHLYADDSELVTYWTNGPLLTTRVFRDGEGRAQLPFSALNSEEIRTQYLCTHSEQPGGVHILDSTRNDAPGSVTLWDRKPYTDYVNYVLPGLEPGESIWPSWRFRPGTTSPIGPITGLAWSADRAQIFGIAAIYRDDDLLASDYATLFTVDPSTHELLSAKDWDTVGTRNTSNNNIDIYPIDGSDITVDADGTLRASTADGRLHILDERASLSPEPWGRVDNHGTLVTQTTVRVDLYGRIRERFNDTAFVWGGPEATCFPERYGCRFFTAPIITDYVVRDNIVYILDGLSGHVWSLEPDETISPTLVATGFYNATRIFARHHGDDSALYVWDTNLYRVVPGSTVGVRP